jgi:hypothetical protein
MKIRLDYTCSEFHVMMSKELNKGIIDAVGLLDEMTKQFPEAYVADMEYDKDGDTIIVSMKNRKEDFVDDFLNLYSSVDEKEREK